MKLSESQRALTRVCMDGDPSDEDLRALGGVPSRWRLYRSMVRQRFVDTLGEAMPRTREALGAQGFSETVAAWLDRSPPTTRYVRELTVQYVRFLASTPDAVPEGAAPWCVDLARYEGAVMEAHIAHDATSDGVTDFDMGLPAALAPAQSFLRVSWRVHHRGEESAAGAWPLLVYRGEGDRVETLEFTAIAGDIYEAMLDSKRTVTECATAALAKHASSAGPVFVESFGNLLGDLMERGILLGSARRERS